MRPLQLTMQAFGSYGERTTIDFTKPNQNLFLVTGDTGSGKTTIFEAIVFALYGRSSDKSGKSGRTGMDFQSQYVGKNVVPFVELKFSEREGEEDRYYVVTRIPQHERKLLRRSKSNPEGIRVESESVTMILLPEADSEEGTPVAQSMGEINRKIIEIVGLSKEQFTQVAMIEQGKFMEMLRSSTDERKKIFSRLFNTGIYQRITEETATRLRGVRGKSQSLLEVCRSAVQQTVIPEGDADLFVRMREEKETIRTMEHFALKRLADFSEDLAALDAKLGNEKVTADARREEAIRERDGAREALTRAESLAAAYRQLSDAEQTLIHCAEQVDEIGRKQDLLEKIGKSFEILAVKRNADASKKRMHETEEKIRELEKTLPVLEKQHSEAKQRAETAEKRKNDALASFTAVKEKAARAIAALREIETDRADAIKKRREAREAAERTAKASEQLTEIGENERAARMKAEEYSDVPVRLEKINGRLTLGEKLKDRAVELQKESAACEQARGRSKKLQDQYHDAGIKYNDALITYRDMRTNFFDNIAGVIASDLKDGVPCPVCGSVCHPHPATKKKDAEITEEALDRLEKETDALGEAQRKLSEAAGSAKAMWKEQEKGFREGTAKLFREAGGYVGGSDAGLFSDEILKEAEERFSGELPENTDKIRTLLDNAYVFLEKIVSEIRQEARRLEQAENERIAAASAAKRFGEKLESLTVATEHLQEEKKKAETEAQRSEAVLENVSRERPEFQSEEEAKAAVDAAKDASRRAEKEYRSALADEKSLKTTADQTQALLTERRRELPVLTGQYNQEVRAYREAMEIRVMSEVEWMHITEEYPDDKAASRQLREEIGTFKETQSSAERLKAAAQEVIGTREKPDLAALEKEKERTEERYRVAAQAAEAADRICQTNGAVLSTLREKIKEGENSVSMEEHLSHLYAVLAGKISGSRMDVETFVQRYYLEQILVSANARFREMSMGQFELRMVGMDRAGEGKNRGLDLSVFSYVTGKEREVRTLSGGESFMAALSLALGLADQITAGSSSIHLDMMFIDEGFGTLDDRSLEQAVRTLRKMAGGSKLIGIISHVAELRQEMEDQLIVTKDDRGSHAKWQIS
jgi:exonuclease SbcC